MTFLELCQTLRRECRVPGSGPTTVIDQTGEMLDLVSWIIQAHTELQTLHGGRWRWLKRPFTLNTVAAQASYDWSDATDVDASAAISRFGAWQFVGAGNQPRVYLTATGVSVEQRLAPLAISRMRDVYDRGTARSGPPAYVAINDQDGLRFGPTPDDIYTVNGYYFRGPQILALDADIPEMPTAYHMAIVYRAMIDYGYNDVAQEIIQRAEVRYNALMNTLTGTQLLAGNIQHAGPLA